MGCRYWETVGIEVQVDIPFQIGIGTQCKKYNAFYIGEMGQIPSKRINGHWFTCMVVNSDLRYPSTPNPISSLSRDAGPSVSFTNFRMPPRLFETVYQLVLQSRQSPGINIR